MKFANIGYGIILFVLIQACSSNSPYRVVSKKDTAFYDEIEFSKHIEPIYPEFEKENGIEGMVKLRVEILDTGDVGRIEIIESPTNSFSEAAIEAVKQWQFEKVTKKGNFLPELIEFPIYFNLSKKHKKHMVKDVSLETGPEVIKTVQPIYPNFARRRRIEGEVLLQVEILRNGTVGQVDVLKSPEESLSKAAVDAVKKWTFKPATGGGKNIVAYLNIPFIFYLE